MALKDTAKEKTGEPEDRNCPYKEQRERLEKT